MSDYIANLETVLQTLCTTGQKVMQGAVAPLKAYGTTLEIVDPDQRALDSVVPIVTGAAATQVAGRSDVPAYKVDALTISPVVCNHNLVIQAANLENQIYQSGGRVEWAVRFCARQFAEALVDHAKSFVTTDVFGPAVVTASPTEWNQGSFATLRGSLATPTLAMVLKNTYDVPQTWLPASGNCQVYECSRWSTAGENIVGFVASPEALFFRHGLPKLMPIGARVVRTQSFPLSIGIEVEASTWYDLQTRTICFAYQVYFAAAVGDANALKILKSA